MFQYVSHNGWIALSNFCGNYQTEKKKKSIPTIVKWSGSVLRPMKTNNLEKERKKIHFFQLET